MLKNTIIFFELLLKKSQAHIKKNSQSLLMQVYRLSLWIRLQSAYQAMELKKKSASLIDSEIRLCRDSLPQIGEDEDTDSIVEYISRQLTNRPHLLVLDKALEKHSELAVALLEDARESTSVKSAAKLYFLADAFFQALCTKHQEEEDSFQRAQMFDSNAQKLTIADLNKSLRLTKRRLREVKSSLAERSALKIDVKLSDISTIIAILSFLVAISGYLYTHYFYSLFGVDVSLFFSITDYLAASVEQVRYGAISAFCAFIALLIGLRAGSMRSVAYSEATKEQRKRRLTVAFSFSLLVLAGGALTIYLGRPSFPMMQLAVVMFSQRISWFISNKFFHRPLPVFISITGLLTFFGYIAVAGYQKYFDTLHIEERRARTQVILKEDIFKGQDQAYLLGSNSSFLFLIEAENRSVHVVPRLQLKEVRVSSK